MQACAAGQRIHYMATSEQPDLGAGTPLTLMCIAFVIENCIEEQGSPHSDRYWIMAQSGQVLLLNSQVPNFPFL